MWARWGNTVRGVQKYTYQNGTDFFFSLRRHPTLFPSTQQIKEIKESVDRSSREEAAQAAAGATAADATAPSLDAGKRFFPYDRVADPGVAVLSLKDAGMYVASPSIVRLPSGRLLTVLERSIPWGANQAGLTKLVFASDNEGVSWSQIGTLGPMNWPQVFKCASGVYVIGTQRHFSADNNLVISRMLDAAGAQWSRPAQLTTGWSVVAANTGVDVSAGRVTKSFEFIPSMARPVTGTTLREPVTLPFAGGPRSSSWQHQPVLELPVESVAGFVPFTLLKVPPPAGVNGSHAFFFRILEVDEARQSLVVRLERFNHYWATAPTTLEKGRAISVGSSSNVYGGVDWVAMAMSADESANLTDPSAWSFSTPLGNPASVYANEMRVLFDVAFRPDSSVRESIVGARLGNIRDNEEAFEAGFGSLYWMEGVITRLQDRHGGNGRLLGLMRVNNDLMCDLAAVVEYDDSSFLDESVGPGWGQKGAPGAPDQPALKARFLRYTNIPGLSVAHPSVVYDATTDLYWMVTNVNRDSVREWKQPGAPSTLNPRLHITPFSKCEVDRSTLALFYSPNLLDWVAAGVVDYHTRLGRHFTYPHMVVDGQDLLIVSRASFSPWSKDTSDRLPDFFNNHNSNSISFHRVRQFRALANARWANEQGEYSAKVRKSTNSVGSLVHTLVGTRDGSGGGGGAAATAATQDTATAATQDTAAAAQDAAAAQTAATQEAEKVEEKPVEQQAEAQKAEENKAEQQADAQAAEAKTTEQAAEAKTAEQQAAEAKTTEGQAAEAKTADQADAQTAEEKGAGRRLLWQ